MPAEADEASAMTGPSNSVVSGDASFSSSGHKNQEPEVKQEGQQKPAPPATAKKRRNLPGTPDPAAEVVALSPRTLLATNRFVCEVCGKGFQRDQNLQLHRRGHNLPWKLKRTEAAAAGGAPARKRRVYVCPEESCVHHHPSRALGDLTGIKKHFCRKHGEKKWRCERCSKKYAVMSDWKAHCKTCGSREYRCNCGTVFNRRDSFITHRAFCDALAEETATAPPSAVSSVPDSATTEKVDPSAAVAPEAASLAPTPAVASPPMLASPTRSPSEEKPLPQLRLPPEKNVLDTAADTAPIHHRIPPPTPQPVVQVGSSLDGLPQRHSSGMFAEGLFPPVPPPVVDHKTQPQMFAGVVPTADHAVGTLGSSAAAAVGLSLFASPPQQPPPSPHMSATALLQKAAQMGSAATNASLLRGLGLAAASSSAPASSLVHDPVAAGLGLGLLPYDGRFAELVMGGGQSSLCGPRPAATLDFLGLGMAGAGAGPAGGGFTALFTSIAGAGIDLAPTRSFATELPDRQPPTGLL